MAAWAARWRMTGAGPEEVQAKMGKILQGAEPPRSEDEVISLLTGAGFKQPLRFFESLFWGRGWPDGMRIQIMHSSRQLQTLWMR